MEFLGLEIAKRALMAQERALLVSGHNVANASTPGYTRQRVILRAVPPPEGTELRGIAGGGVEVGGITRLRDLFLDLGYREQAEALGRWEVRSQYLAQVEEILREPSDFSLGAALDAFWDAWQLLSLNPESMAAREQVRQRGEILVERFQEVDRRLSDLVYQVDRTVEAKVAEVNQIASRVADLNRRIVLLGGEGKSGTADLEDERDLLLDRLSRLVGAKVYHGEEGLRVMVGDHYLVAGDRWFELGAEPDPGLGGVYRVVWAASGERAYPEGELGALMEVRDRDIAGYREDLRRLAWGVASEVNGLHAGGYDLAGNPVAGQPWQNFFVNKSDLSPPDYGFTAYASFRLADWRVNPEIAADVRRIAAAKNPGLPGDGSNALAIADIRRVKVAFLDDATPGDFHRRVIGSLGVAARGAQDQTRTQELLVQQIEQQRQATSGVNLDEEMMEMVRAQHAYGAAAKLAGVVDEMLRLLLERVGA